jgi:hypothetical protein
MKNSYRNCRGFISFNNFIMNTHHDSETLMLSGDREVLQLMKQEREIRGLVARALKGTKISPVYIEFRLAHPWLKRFGLGSDEHRRVILALEKGDTLDADLLGQLNAAISAWAQWQEPTLDIDPVSTRRAGILDYVNGYVQDHGMRVTDEQ